VTASLFSRRSYETAPTWRTRPPELTACNGGKGAAPIAMSDATAAKSIATSDEQVRNRPRLPQSPRNNDVVPRIACLRGLRTICGPRASGY
jgi:hypothetical protein